ncbi:adenylosuccinate lyase [Natronogracilivirga saccharolytica]|uniref:Adenylosuccinate lyase n=1 Tax=Natronogracilivirga saccharolytica TaxID=2812953 RepID=A0A8J7S6Z0_9BACT|nr:adenylosuccinate lyase [Natronogracilivirga saccharolytica]MBP3193093.1 adenylosuccinate lyase [Natronogracilivirga saccharolytica]
MIERYAREKMASVWTEEQQFQAWLDVELAACKAWSRLGVIPEEDVQKLFKHAGFDIERIHEIEKETRHDVVAFTRAVSETLGDEKKWVHYGLTSTDVVDTALGLRLRKANEIIRNGLDYIIDVLADKAREHKNTVMMGRTHGIHAEPTTFGLKCALWFEEMKRNRTRFDQASEAVEFGKLSGAVGTFANIPPEVESYTCELLGLSPAPVSTQTLQRDRHAHYMSVLALIGSSLEKIAVEIRHLQRTEVREAEEQFKKGQKGSSAMPHKRNPVSSENITGCARVLRGYMTTAFENIALWHERDISHSSAERIIIPDALILLDYMLHRFAGVVSNLVVYPENMRANIDKTHGVVFSQQLLLKLVEKGMSREQAYDIVQPLAMDAWENRKPFRELVEKSDEITSVLGKNELEKVFDLNYHIRNVDIIFDRAGL